MSRNPLIFSVLLMAAGDLLPARLDAATSSIFTGSLAPLASDTATTKLAKSHAIAEVRDAIAMCRQGKYSEAIPVLSKHAGAKDIGATYVLARLYSEGLGVARSEKTASDLLAANVLGGHGPSMFALAEMKEGAEPVQALNLYKQAMAAGELSATVRLGTVYENGELGIKENPKLAFSYYQKAAAAGHPLGDFNLARFYDAGIEVSANEIQATRLYRKSALAGVTFANPVMARRYFEGKGLEADPIAAIGWLVRGAEKGSPEAMVLLGERYELGDTLPQNLNRAGELFSQAAKLGDPAGTFKLAMMYLNGIGTKADPVRAFVLLSGAQSLPKAQEALEQLEKKLTTEELTLAKKKLAEQAP